MPRRKEPQDEYGLGTKIREHFKGIGVDLWPAIRELRMEPARAATFDDDTDENREQGC